VTTNAMRTGNGLAVFFSVHEDIELPPHSHKAQWGTVLAGRLDLTVDGTTTTYHPGDSYFIPSGVTHAVRVAAGSRLLDVFEEPDRYPLKG